MASQSISTKYAASPAATLPYDILQEIFLLCLPENPLDQVQPNTQIAPLLLCHVCSSWRTATLEMPPLWAYLYYRLPIRWDDGQPIAWDSELFLRDVEWLKWWRRKQSASLIHFEFYKQKDGHKGENKELVLTPDIIKFFIEYLSSARYLDVDPLTLYLFRHDSGSILSRIQSLVTSHPNSDGTSEALPVQGHPWLLPLRIPPTLRRLRLHDVALRPALAKTFSNWSKLTHLSLHDTAMTLEVWYSLLRGVPNLKSAYLDVYVSYDIDEEYNPPATFTLPFLSTLSIASDSPKVTVAHETLGLLLENIHLPSLHDLSIYLQVQAQDIPNMTTTINNRLKYAPAVTKLTLGFEFIGYAFLSSMTTAQHWNNVEKLPKSAPCLTQLVLDICPNLDGDPDNERRPFDDNLICWTQIILCQGCWLDVENPTGAIRKITAVVGPVERRWVQEQYDFSVEDIILHHLDRPYFKEVCGVVIEVVEEDKDGCSPSSGRWKTWGSPL